MSALMAQDMRSSIFIFDIFFFPFIFVFIFFYFVKYASRLPVLCMGVYPRYSIRSVISELNGYI